MKKILSEELVYEILSVVEEIPEGRVASYGQIARLIGRERNSRLVGKVLSMSEFYGVTVEYGNSDARTLRFYYEWNRQSDIEEVIDDLNRFAKLNITKNNNKLIVE